MKEFSNSILAALIDIEDHLDGLDKDDPRQKAIYDDLILPLGKMRLSLLEHEMNWEGEELMPKDVVALEKEGEDCYLCMNEAKWRKNEVLTCSGCVWVAPYHVDNL